MKSWRNLVVGPSTSIHNTIRIIDAGALQIALVADAQGKLLGTVTDGDIRRAILRGSPLSGEVQTIMNTQPITLQASDSRKHILAAIRRTHCRRLPVLNAEGVIVNLINYEDYLQGKESPNIVVLMAGGLGTRLRPLTYECPKPLLRIGNKPVLQTIIENFQEQGFTHFYLSVNYKAEMIQEYFGDGSQLGVTIQYLYEKERRGTAGALTLLPKFPDEPFIVMNGDLLTKVDYHHLLNFHHEHRAYATMCVREYDFQVPYGVVNIVHHHIASIQEKPVHRFFVNAGIYVLEPEVLDLIPSDCYFDMPTLFEKLLEQGKDSIVFPIHEYWIDIGQMADLERANHEFPNTFNDD